jgi:hypothetical protein
MSTVAEPDRSKHAPAAGPPPAGDQSAEADGSRLVSVLAKMSRALLEYPPGDAESTVTSVHSAECPGTIADGEVSQ